MLVHIGTRLYATISVVDIVRRVNLLQVRRCVVSLPSEHRSISAPSLTSSLTKKVQFTD